MTVPFIIPFSVLVASWTAGFVLQIFTAVSNTRNNDRINVVSLICFLTGYFCFLFFLPFTDFHASNLR